ncbi:MAG: HAD family hydrolase [Chloroflexi bacterium]|nr:MAG: HAD family hydrolase [Chloroflexota bacterium]
MQRITHVIYDLDGTLLDTEPLYRLATQEILDRYGASLPVELRAAMIGRPTPVAARVLVEMTGIPMTPEAFAAERDARLVSLFATAQPTRGALALTTHLRKHGVPQAIATSSMRHSLEAKRVAQPEWFASFDAIVTSEDVEHGKPAPDIFLEAARRIGGTPQVCLVLEDAPLGVQGALAAGMWVVALPEAGHEGLVAGAHRVIAHLDEFDPREWGLPAFP